jgi:hypothetical protein
MSTLRTQDSDLSLPVWVWLYCNDNQRFYPASTQPDKCDDKETALIPERQISCSSDLEWNLSLNHTDYKDAIFYKFMLCNITQNGQDKTQ